MDEIIKLQEQYDDLVRKQDAIITRSKAVVEGKEVGLSDVDDKEFDQIGEQRKAITKQIETAKKFEEVRMAKAQEKIGTPAIHTEKRVYSLERAFQAAAVGNWNDAGLEREINEERASKIGKQHGSHTLFLDTSSETGQKRASQAALAGLGSEFVGTNLQAEKFIDVIFNDSIIGGLNVNRNTGIKGLASVPVNTAKPTATMVGEVAALPAATDLATSIKIASPKEMVTKSQMSRLFSIQSAIDVKGLIRKHVTGAIAEKLDTMFVAGSGVAPLLPGILNGENGEPTVIPGAYTPLVPTNGTVVDYKALVNLWMELGKKNRGNNLQWIMNSQVVAKLMTTLKDAANTNSGYIMSDQMMSALLGYPVVKSQSLPGTYNKGTGSNLSPIILGNFTETEIYQWDTVVVEFDPYTAADNSMTTVRSYSYWDFLHLRPENYAVLRNCITT
jgi:HK97 family phage major capsid protein